MKQAPLFLGAGALVAAWFLLPRMPSPTPSNPAPPDPPTPTPPQTPTLPKTRTPPSDSLDVEAIGRMLVSETGKREAWPWLLVAARNTAAARHMSIASLLRTKQGQIVGWGRNKDGHWASTRFGATAETLAWARRWLAGQIPDPPGSLGVRSFFEVVDEKGIHHDPSSFRKRNPELQLAATVAGWEFYRRRSGG